MSSTKSARVPASTEVLPVHFTAAGGFYRSRPKLSAVPCRAAGHRAGTGYIGRTAVHRAGGGVSSGRRLYRADSGPSSGQRSTTRAMTRRTRWLCSSGGRLSDVVHAVRTGASEHRSFAGAPYGAVRLLSTPAQVLGRTMPGDGVSSERRLNRADSGPSSGQRATKRAMTRRTRWLCSSGGRLRRCRPRNPHGRQRVTKALLAHFTALGGFYRSRPKLSAVPCRAAGHRAGTMCIGRTAAH